MTRSATLLSLAFAVALGVNALPVAQDNGLPDKATFLTEVRKRLRDDRAVMSQYTYKQTNRRFRLDRAGRPELDEVKLYEVYPSLEEGLSYRRLISVNGRPVNPADLAREDEKQQKKVQARVAQLQREGISEKERRLRKEEEARRKEERTMDEIVEMFDLQLVRREPRAGTTTIVVDFQPRPGHRARTDTTKWLQKMKGRAWISERDYQVVRVEVETLQTISVGLGLLARLNKGGTASFERQRMAGDVWLPAETRFSGNGRILLFKGFRVDASTEFSDYRKLTADTLTTFTLPKSPQ